MQTCRKSGQFFFLLFGTMFLNTVINFSSQEVEHLAIEIRQKKTKIANRFFRQLGFSGFSECLLNHDCKRL